MYVHSINESILSIKYICILIYVYTNMCVYTRLLYEISINEYILSLKFINRIHTHISVYVY